jgi:hypothetical protein
MKRDDAEAAEFCNLQDRTTGVTSVLVWVQEVTPNAGEGWRRISAVGQWLFGLNTVALEDQRSLNPSKWSYGYAVLMHHLL